MCMRIGNVHKRILYLSEYFHFRTIIKLYLPIIGKRVIKKHNILCFLEFFLFRRFYSLKVG